MTTKAHTAFTVDSVQHRNNDHIFSQIAALTIIAVYHINSAHLLYDKLESSCPSIPLSMGESMDDPSIPLESALPKDDCKCILFC